MNILFSTSKNNILTQFGCIDRSWNMKLEDDTDLQIDLQALVIHFCFKSDKMELLCDNQRGLQKADAAWKKNFVGCRACIKRQEKTFLAEQTKRTILSQISPHELGLLTSGLRFRNITYITVRPATISTSLFSQGL